MYKSFTGYNEVEIEMVKNNDVLIYTAIRFDETVTTNQLLVTNVKVSPICHIHHQHYYYGGSCSL